MIKIALILKNICRQVGDGWPLRFKSNEVGIIFNNCDAQKAEEISKQLAREIADIEPVPASGEHPEFHFSSTISWSIWPVDSHHGAEWNSFFQSNYANLLDTWKASGDTIVHFINQEKI